MHRGERLQESRMTEFQIGRYQSRHKPDLGVSRGLMSKHVAREFVNSILSKDCSGRLEITAPVLVYNLKQAMNRVI